MALLVGLLSGGIVIAVAISFFEGDTTGRVRKELSHSYLFYLRARYSEPSLRSPHAHRSRGSS